MFSKRNYLQEDDKKILDNVRYKYLAAVDEYAKNPTHFLSIIECLKVFEEGDKEITDVMARAIFNEDKNHSYFEAMGKRIFKMDDTLFKEIVSRVYPKLVIDYLKNEFSKGGVVNALHANALPESNFREYQYKMNFLDGDEFVFYSLEDKEELARAEKFFISKQKKLIQENSDTLIDYTKYQQCAFRLGYKSIDINAAHSYTRYDCLLFNIHISKKHEHKDKAISLGGSPYSETTTQEGEVKVQGRFVKHF